MPVRSYLDSPAAKAVLDTKLFAAVSVSRRYYKGNLGDIKKRSLVILSGFRPVWRVGCRAPVDR